MKTNRDTIENVLKKSRTIIYIGLIVVLVILNIRMYKLSHGTQEEKETNEVVVVENKLSKEEIDQKNNEARINELYSMSQRERIKRYLGEYTGFLKNKDYKSAYDKLNDKFKMNYFQTESSFEEYIKTYYPKDLMIEYGTFSEEGEISIVEIILSDESDPNYQKVTQRFVIRENDAMDYTISFQK